VDDSVVSLVAAEQDLATVGGGDCLLENNFEIYSFNCRPLISVVELLIRLWSFYKYVEAFTLKVKNFVLIVELELRLSSIFPVVKLSDYY
jgi:hypothetical protein